MYGHPSKTPKQSAVSVAVAACAFELSTSSAIQLTPAGSFAARDGRPVKAGKWVITDEIAQRILAKLKSRQDDIVIDYEHQTLHAEKNGEKAPAAGWFNGSDVEWRPGEGFFVMPAWTDAAKAHIDAKEYRYFSPVLVYNKKTGEVLDILMGAITNYAAIDGMDEIELMAAAKFSTESFHQPTEDHLMNEKLRKLLGLKKDASDDDVMVALKAVLDKNTEAETAIAAAKAETPKDAIESMQVLQKEVAALTARITGREVDELVDIAVGEGKLLPAQEDWARKLGESDISALKSYLDSAEPIAALKGTQTKGKKPEGSEGEALDADDLAICKHLGVDPEEYKKTKQEAA